MTECLDALLQQLDCVGCLLLRLDVLPLGRVDATQVEASQSLRVIIVFTLLTNQVLSMEEALLRREDLSTLLERAAQIVECQRD